ncbi:MAG TPA: hypothetical protein PLQ80_10075, partial [Candidatus Syntrophosphaera sp.]|nr:hypothetical protein [Candidatus Syntrophosphaera sp.]
LFDATYDYTTPTYLFIGGDLYTSTSTGEWAIGAYVQTGGPALYFPPEPTVALNGSGNPEVTWAALSGAASYDVYGSPDPYAADPWTLLSDNQIGTTYTYTGAAPMQFFKIVASTNIGGGRTARNLNPRTLPNAPELIRAEFEPIKP